MRVCLELIISKYNNRWSINKKNANLKTIQICTRNNSCYE